MIQGRKTIAFFYISGFPVNMHVVQIFIHFEIYGHLSNLSTSEFDLEL